MRLQGRLVFEISANNGTYFAVCKGWYRDRNAGVGNSPEAAFQNLIEGEGRSIDPTECFFEAEEGVSLPVGWEVADWSQR